MASRQLSASICTYMNHLASIQVLKINQVGRLALSSCFPRIYVYTYLCPRRKPCGNSFCGQPETIDFYTALDILDIASELLNDQYKYKNIKIQNKSHYMGWLSNNSQIENDVLKCHNEYFPWCACMHNIGQSPDIDQL